jgi:hypothetical protein
MIMNKDAFMKKYGDVEVVQNSSDEEGILFYGSLNGEKELLVETKNSSYMDDADTSIVYKVNDLNVIGYQIAREDLVFDMGFFE